MKKAQSLIIQFVIFFMIGFTLFLTIGTFLKARSDIFREETLNYGMVGVSSYVSSLAINLFDYCKQCDFVRTSFRIENVTAGYFFELEFLNAGKGLRVLALPGGKYHISSIHNLNSSLLLSGKSISLKTITLTFDKTKNELRIE
ncbi:MAG: hypothetical protein QXX38_01900 [Candidatus Aenigmatarchaeota archaeon]